MDRDEFSLGRFRLDMRQRQLTRDGAPVQLSGRALDILCVLAGANGEVVSKDELMTRVWPGLVVEENNIQVHVSALRKALDDGKSAETYLMNVPGRGYRLVGLKASRSAAEDPRGNPPLTTTSSQPLIAVLPFQNMSGDPEQDYFADGMVEEMITGLSRIKWLSVVSRNSSFIYKNKPVTITEVAEKFGVRYVLEGGVRRAGTGSGSARSLSTRRLTLTYGQSNMTGSCKTCSPCRTKLPCASSAPWSRACGKPRLSASNVNGRQT